MPYIIPQPLPTLYQSKSSFRYLNNSSMDDHLLKNNSPKNNLQSSQKKITKSIPVAE
jgi:hypothetical protein